MLIRRKDWEPKKIADFVNMVKTFKKEFPVYGLTMGYIQQEIDDILAEITVVEADFLAKITAQDAAEAAVSKFNSSKKVLSKTLRTNVPRIKSSPAYTEDIGKILEIIGEEVVIDPDTLQPELKILMTGGIPEIKWKKGYAEAVSIHCKRGSETEFEFLARDFSSPYKDSRENLEPGKPELREYSAYYIFDDTETGLESKTVKITVKSK
jgi:hypothetical protein